MKNLLAYLYGSSQRESEAEEVAAAVERIMEAAEATEPLKVKRSPLIAALKAIGLDDVDKEVEYDPEGFSLVCPEESEYRRYVHLLMEPDAMEKLAKLGWVVTRCGDVAMSAEPAEFRIRFLEIYGTDNGEDHKTWPAPNNALMTKIIKQGREFATTPMDRDSENEINPVKNPDTAPDKKHAGMGDDADGKDPEGKPKGSTKSEAQRMADSLLSGVNEKRDKAAHLTSSARRFAARQESRSLRESGHKPGCTCGFCRNKGRFGKKDKEEKGDCGDAGGDTMMTDNLHERAVLKKPFWGHKAGTKARYTPGHPPDPVNKYTGKLKIKGSLPASVTDKDKGDLYDLAGQEPPRYDDMFSVMDGKPSALEKVRRTSKNPPIQKSPDSKPVYGSHYQHKHPMVPYSKRR